MRKATAEKFYVALLSEEDAVPEEHYDKVISTLTEVVWDGPVGDCRASRNDLCDCFGLPRPKLKSSGAAAASKNAPKDELGSYKGC